MTSSSDDFEDASRQGKIGWERGERRRGRSPIAVRIVYKGAAGRVVDDPVVGVVGGAADEEGARRQGSERTGGREDGGRQPDAVVRRDEVPDRGRDTVDQRRVE